MYIFVYFYASIKMKKQQQQSDFIQATNIHCFSTMHEYSIAQSCLALCNPVVCSPPGLPCP